MKYTKILLMLLVYTQLLQAQPRINRNTNVSISKVSPIATNFIGWKYNDFVGKWVAYYNQIEDGYFDHNDIRPSRIKAEVQAAGENLQSIRLRKVVYNSKPYYILSIGRYAGVYMYPSICKDWRYWKETELYLLFPDQYKKLLNLGKDNDIILYYTINVSSIADIKSIQQAFPYIFKGKDMDEETAQKEHTRSHLYIRVEDDKHIRLQSPFCYDSSNPFTDNSPCLSYYEINKNEFFNVIRFDSTSY